MIEEEDVIQAKNGDEEAIEKILKEYQVNIYRNNRSFFIKGGDVDDLLQEGFIGLLKAIKSYDVTKNTCFTTFANICIRRQLITAIKNSNSDKYKNLNLAIQGNDYSECAESIKYDTPSFGFCSPEDIYLGKELIAQLNDFLDKNLSKLEKKVFKYLCKEYTYTEIAKMIDEPPKKVDNTIQRIKKKMSIYLENYPR